jgi:hypothetical protein
MGWEAGPVFAAAVERGSAGKGAAPPVEPGATDPAAPSYRPAHHVVQLQAELEERAQEVKSLAALAEDRDRVILARDADIASLKGAVAERDARAAALGEEVASARAESAAAHAELAEIKGSRGWRLVLALRRLRRLLSMR